MGSLNLFTTSHSLIITQDLPASKSFSQLLSTLHPPTAHIAWSTPQSKYNERGILILNHGPQQWSASHVAFTELERQNYTSAEL